MGDWVAENELGSNQKLVGGAQRGMSRVTPEALFTVTLHEVCFTKMAHHIELYYLKNSTAPGVGDGQ